MEILKATFDVREPGSNWQICSMDSLKVFPSTDHQHGLSKVKDDLQLLGRRSFGPTSYYLGQSIVPVVALLNGQARFKCIGTGFFVSCSGLLITAAHVICDPIDREYGAAIEVSELKWQSDLVTLGVMVPTHPIFQAKGYVFRPLEWATFLAEKTESPIPFQGVDLRLNADVGICKVRQPDTRVPYQPLAMIQRGIRGIGTGIGRTATAIGYGEMTDEVQLEVVGPSQVTGNLPFQLHISSGIVLEHFADNAQTRAVRSPGPCFSASMPFPPGMSGSPIFDHDGIYAHGVVSTGLTGPDGLMNHGYGSMLAHALHLPIAPLDGKNLLDVASARNHGIVIMQGSGDL